MVAGYNNLGTFVKLLESTTKRKNNKKRRWSSGKRYSGRSLAMSQQVITTWGFCNKLLDNAMKQKNTT